MALCARQGHEVVLADVSDGAASSNGTPAERQAEAVAAMKILGAAERINAGLPDLSVESENPQHVAAIVDVIRRVQPDLVLIPLSHDPHPDHAAGGILIERAVYTAGIAGYTSSSQPWRVRNGLIYPGRRELEPDLVVDITSTFDVKLRAIEAHATQFKAGSGREATPLNTPEFLPAVEARARLHGQRIGVRFGEPYRLLQPLAATDLSTWFG